ncbi:MAG: SMC-Scp complex subunit ScpB [Thermoplasmata archaeon]
MKARGIVEAALFSSSQPLRITEIAERTGLGKDVIRKALNQLRKTYNKTESAIEISRIGQSYIMKVKEEYSDEVLEFSEPQIAHDVLKTASLIAYHQPIRQSDLKTLVGSKVYNHVKILRDMGLVITRRKGLTYEIVTSGAFSEYFGLPSSNREIVKKVVAERIGIE